MEEKGDLRLRLLVDWFGVALQEQREVRLPRRQRAQVLRQRPARLYRTQQGNNLNI